MCEKIKSIVVFLCVEMMVIDDDGEGGKMGRDALKVSFHAVCLCVVTMKGHTLAVCARGSGGGCVWF